ncbi:aminotransferase class I/II-fold pyridoxal phosphate-dependent enzyme, partial [Patescibacteria group bacterium]|nr:aminotransferase class I/II-fold pyridoxal phosphate-dependent enzyme [Patescibacteria group bacterium]
MRQICSRRVLNIPHSGIRYMFNLAAKYPEAIHLCIGEPDFSTPSFIIQKAYQAAKNGFTHYTPNAGILELREAISEKYQEEQGIFYNPNKEILVTVGAMEALALTMMVVLNPGDEVILPSPSWPNYESQVLLGGGEPVFVPVKEEEGWIPTKDRISNHLTSQTKAILLNSPNNPTGAVYNLKQLEEIAKISLDKDTVVVSDEAYEKIIYEGKHHSIASIPGMKERSIVINTFSKSYAMTGWR